MSAAIASLAEDRVVEGIYAVARKERRRKTRRRDITLCHRGRCDLAEAAQKEQNGDQNTADGGKCRSLILHQ